MHMWPLSSMYSSSIVRCFLKSVNVFSFSLRVVSIPLSSNTALIPLGVPESSTSLWSPHSSLAASLPDQHSCSRHWVCCQHICGGREHYQRGTVLWPLGGPVQRCPLSVQLVILTFHSSVCLSPTTSVPHPAHPGHNPKLHRQSLRP